MNGVWGNKGGMRRLELVRSLNSQLMTKMTQE